MDPLHEPRGVDARPGPGRAGAPPGRAGHRAGRLPPDRDDALRRRAAARRAVAGEGRGDDELGAPADLPAQARRSAGRGAARRRDPHALRARDGLEGRVPVRERGGDLRRVRGAHGGHAVRLLRREPRAARRRGPAPVAGAGARPSRAPRASTPTAASPRRDGRARFVAVEHAEPLEPPDARFPADAHDRARARPLAHADAHRQGAGAAAAHAGADARGQPPRRPARRRSRTATSSRSPRGAARRWRSAA